MKFNIGEYGWTITEPDKRYFVRVLIMHIFELDRPYYVIATRTNPDLVLHVRDDGNLYKENPDEDRISG